MKDPQFVTTATVQVLVEVTVGPYPGAMSLGDFHDRVKREALHICGGMCIDTGDRRPGLFRWRRDDLGLYPDTGARLEITKPRSLTAPAAREPYQQRHREAGRNRQTAERLTPWDREIRR